MMMKKLLIFVLICITHNSSFTTENNYINKIYADFDTAFREVFGIEAKDVNNTEDKNIQNDENKSNSTQKEINEIQNAINKLNLNNKKIKVNISL